LIHKALESYYVPGVKRGPDPWITFGELYEEELRSQMAIGFRDEDGKWNEAADLGEAMLRGYVQAYGGDEEWRVISSEQVFEQKVAPGVIAIGVMDGVWQHRSKKEIAIVDHKAVAQIVTRHLLLDDQAGQYWSFGIPYLRNQGIIKKDDHVAFMLFNFLRKAMPDERPKNADGYALNKDGTVSKNQPSELFVRHKAYRDEAAQKNMRLRTMQEANEIISARKGEIPLIKSPGQMNCGSCWVRDVCELHDVNQDWKAMASAILQHRDGSKVGQLHEALDYERSR
jgi:hypothetical protein